MEIAALDWLITNGGTETCRNEIHPGCSIYDGYLLMMHFLVQFVTAHQQLLAIRDNLFRLCNGRTSRIYPGARLLPEYSAGFNKAFSDGLCHCRRPPCGDCGLALPGVAAPADKLQRLVELVGEAEATVSEP
jgi:hypothetical protein